MKQLLFMLCSCAAMAQAPALQDAGTLRPPHSGTVSGFVDVSNPSHAGIFVEHYRKKAVLKDFHRSRIYQIAGTQLAYDAPGYRIQGRGFELGLGSRQYWEKGQANGLYTENLFTYGQVDVVDRNLNFSGTYAYWSIFNTRLGYKAYFSKNWNLEPYVGVMWKWEVRGRGDVDNIYVDNWVWSAGVKLGYSFR